MEQKIIRKVGIAVFKDGHILMARSKKNAEKFYFPGGKIEPGESDIACMQREAREEISVGIIPESVLFLKEFEGPADGKDDSVRLVMRLYQAELTGEPKPSSEIEELRYFDAVLDTKHLSTIVTEQIFPWLEEQGLIRESMLELKSR